MTKKKELTLDQRRSVPLAERQKRYEDMKALHDGGMTLAAIGAKYGVTRERVRRILDTPPRDAGWPRDRQIENAKRRLNEQRAKWAKRTSEAATRHVAEIDEELARLDAELEKLT